MKTPYSWKQTNNIENLVLVISLFTYSHFRCVPDEYSVPTSNGYGYRVPQVYKRIHTMTLYVVLALLHNYSSIPYAETQRSCSHLCCHPPHPQLLYQSETLHQFKEHHRHPRISEYMNTTPTLTHAHTHTARRHTAA